MATITQIETFTRFLTKTNTTSLTAANLLILENKYYEIVVGRIIEATAGSDTQFGDFNYSAFPTFTINMTNGTAEYALSATSTDPLTIMGVEVKDQNGDWHVLTRTSLKKIHEQGIAQPEYTPDSGRPLEFEIRDSQIVLYPAPDNGVSVTLTAGLRIYYLRTADVFTSAQVTTGTKEPGFPSPWHYLLSWGAAYDYALANGLPTANHFRAEFDRGMKELLSFIAKRDQDTRPVMTMKRVNHI